jgi:hypothetical protein
MIITLMFSSWGSVLPSLKVDPDILIAKGDFKVITSLRKWEVAGRCTCAAHTRISTHSRPNKREDLFAISAYKQDHQARIIISSLNPLAAACLLPDDMQPSLGLLSIIIWLRRIYNQKMHGPACAQSCIDSRPTRENQYYHKA